MTTRRALQWGSLFLLFAAASGTALASAPSSGASGAGSTQAAAAAVLQSQETNFPGIVADVTECKRKDGVLSVKVRLRNPSSQDVDVTVVKNRNYNEFYVTAGGKKYFILRDTEQTPIAALADGFGSLTVNIRKGGGYTWWAKYPAPPDSETKITLVTPLAGPFEDLPIGQ